MEKQTVNLGNEYDAKVWNALKTVIYDLGGQIIDHKWTLVGSQELDSFEVELLGTFIRIESETYIGITLTGIPSVVERIQQLVADRIKED